MLSKSDCGDSFNQTQVILNLQTNYQMVSSAEGKKLYQWVQWNWKQALGLFKFKKKNSDAFIEKIKL